MAHLPPQKPRTGRPTKDHRIVLEGILWVLRTGAPWRDLPERYGSWRTVYSRFRRWQQVGVWDRASPPCNGRRTRTAGSTGHCISWTAPSSGRTSTPPGQKGGIHRPRPSPEALGRSRGGFSTKLHLPTERGGKPLVVVLTGGVRHEQPLLPTLMERGAVKRPGRGRPKVRPDRVAGDKGYSSPAVRHYLRGRRIGVVVPTKADQQPLPTFDRAAYRGRNVVERLINRLKRFRGVATRYEKRAASYRAMVTIAAIVLWL